MNYNSFLLNLILIKVCVTRRNWIDSTQRIAYVHACTHACRLCDDDQDDGLFRLELRSV